MDLASTTEGIHETLLALAYAQPRALAMLTALPLFSGKVVPGTVRLVVASAIAMLAIPVVLPVVHQDVAPLVLLVTMLKEALVGFIFGFVLSVPFYALEAAGLIIDNQRGATISATLDPLTGNDSSPMGLLFNQAFMVFFLLCGGFQLALGVLYDSYRLWPIFEWTPILRPEAAPIVLAELDKIMRLAVLYGAPAIVAMLLAELGLALVNRFVPQLQVFFLAMPIKSALAVLVMIIYLGNLLELVRDAIPQREQALKQFESFIGPPAGTR